MSGQLRRFLQPLLLPIAEPTWTLGLHLTKPLLGRDRTAQEWTAVGGRVLIVAPHPDDETLGAGGVAALHVREGDPVTVAVVTNGRIARAGDPSSDELAARRKREVRAATDILGVHELILLDMPERSWDRSRARAALAPLIAASDVVYAPSCVDVHPDHIGVAHLVASLVGPRQLVRVYEIGVPLTPMLVNLVADISAVEGRKRRALACFTTQMEGLIPLERLARYRNPLYGLAACEVFWELPAQVYSRVVLQSDWDGDASPFWAVPLRPFRDPRAFLAGWRTRAHLRALADQTMATERTDSLASRHKKSDR